MEEKFNEFVDNLQEEIKNKEIEDHNERIVNLFHDPQNWGKLPDEERTVFIEGRGGPKEYFLGLYLKIENDLIVKAKFVTDGCGVMVATGSQMTLLLEGTMIKDAEHLKPEDLDKALMGMPEDERHCADFAIRFLKTLIDKYKHLET